MKMLKKLAALILAATMVLVLFTACGGDGGSTGTREPEKEKAAFESIAKDNRMAATAKVNDPQLLLDYARMAVTEENVGLLAKQALAARSAVAASTLAEEYPRDFARIIGLHTYSQSPRRAYDITLTGNWVERGGFRFEEFILTPRREDADHGRTE